MILNRNDYHMVDKNSGYGVGYQLMTASCFDPQEVDFALALLEKRKDVFGTGVVAIDCGANIGVHTIEWARLMYNWGYVFSFEAQETIYYALAGNVAINNCLNVTARNCAIGAENKFIDIPVPNYLVPASFGSLELKQAKNNEFIGQPIDYSKTRQVPQISIDSLNLNRLDFMKIDVERMEMEVLEGAKQSVEKHKPILMIEIVKSGRETIESFLNQRGYRTIPTGINILAVHNDDPINKSLRLENEALWLD